MLVLPVLLTIVNSCTPARVPISWDPNTLLEEERRLAYVGFTRAMHRLYLVRAMSRSCCGERQDTEPSRFLADIPAHLLAAHQASGSTVTGTQHTSKVGGGLWIPGPVP